LRICALSERVAVLAVLLLTGIGLQLGNPQLMRYVIDTALSQQPIEWVTTAALLFFVLALCQQILGVLITFISENIAWTATNNLRYDCRARGKLALARMDS
jgi:ATP-binding cassette, subfamily B, bacterial